MIRYMRLAAAVFFVAIVTQEAFAAPPSFQVLDLPRWNSDSGVTDVSGDGRVVIGSIGGSPYFLPNQGFRWSGGAVTTLGEIPNRTVARGISHDGSVIVGESGGVAFRWENGVMTSLGVPTGFTSTTGWDVSADGTVVVGEAFAVHASPWTYASLLWDSGVMTVLGTSGVSMAIAVSADGMVVVGNDGGACRWQNGVKSLLGNNVSLPWGVSADGSVVVGGGLPQLFLTEAWRWEDGVATGLGHIPGGDIGSTAWDTSANGSVVVGTAYLSESNTRAFIWTAAAGMRDLNDVLVNDYGLDLAGWTLIDVMGISDDGLTIVGNGIGPNGREGWIAHIPEPATACLLMIGFAALLRKR